MASPFLYPEGSHQLKEMEDDASFLTSTYVVRDLIVRSDVWRIFYNCELCQVHLKRSRGLGEGVAGYGLHLVHSHPGPKVVSIIKGGEADRAGLISIGVSVMSLTIQTKVLQ